MSYAMCLDNSWDVMCEEEMYDVNDEGWITVWFTPTTQRAVLNAEI